jgi:hypothetical protein
LVSKRGQGNGDLRARQYDESNTGFIVYGLLFLVWEWLTKLHAIRLTLQATQIVPLSKTVEKSSYFFN